MHELGIVFHIIRTVEDVARQNDVTRIRRVTLQLGEVSGVVESYLQDCWKWAAAKSELLPGLRPTVPHRAVWPHLPPLPEPAHPPFAGP